MTSKKKVQRRRFRNIDMYGTVMVGTAASSSPEEDQGSQTMSVIRVPLRGQQLRPVPNDGRVKRATVKADLANDILLSLPQPAVVATEERTNME